MELFSLGDSDDPKRRIILATVDSTKLPNLGAEIESKFVCFVAMDAKGVSNDDLEALCSDLIEFGCAYLCAWGPDCERVHDAMDRCIVGSNPPESYLGRIMTTWHSEEAIEKALEFFLTCTEPNEDYAPSGCAYGLAVSIDSSEWSGAIRRYVTSRTEPNNESRLPLWAA